MELQIVAVERQPLKFVKVRNVKSPERGTPRSAGIDFFVPEDDGGMIGPGESMNIPSGIHVKIPAGFALIAMNKSGVALKKGLTVGACVIDEDYQGEVHLHVVNIGRNRKAIKPGEKLIQMLLVPVDYRNTEEVASIEELYQGEETERGSGGFGSTGTGV